MDHISPSLTVVYAQDLERLVAFYSTTLGLPVVERSDDFVVVGGPSVEVAVVKMPAALAETSPLSDPPRKRSETPIKPSFAVEDFERVAAAAIAVGGSIKPVAAAWRWRNQLHLDGQDPEGNVVQFRRRAD
jgi:catechol 2,3-dioxygenase-like lactoylglutathione lyase family enzyme